MDLQLRNQVCELLFTDFAVAGRLVTEQGLAEKLGVGRSLIREIIHYLKLVGVVESRRKKGIFLRRFTIAEIAEFYDVRAALEGLAARLAAENISDNDLELLCDYADSYENGVSEQNLEVVNKADYAFHDKVIEVAGNAYLRKLNEDFLLLQRAFLIEKTLVRSQRLLVLSSANRLPGGIVKHTDILKALRAHDPDQAEKIIKSHVEYAKIAIIQELTGVRQVFPNSAP